jgi:hypothetical protein
MVNYEKEVREQQNAEEPYRESSDESMMMDSQQRDQQGLRLPSNVTPEDYYQYKKFINLPESQAEFETKIDKDVVFANIGGQKPTMEELRFQVGTIDLFESEFVEELWIPRRNQSGDFVRDKDNKIVMDLEIRFDEAFRGCLTFLKAEYKFSVVASRAMGGQDRAAFLDISSNNRIQKEFSKKKETSSKFFGTGGM